MFWCAASTGDNDGDLKAAKWLSITNHIMNKHSGHESPLFSQCLHGRLHGRERKKKWLNPGMAMLILNILYLISYIKKCVNNDTYSYYSRFISSCCSGSQPYEKLTEVLTKCSLLKDIKQMSGAHATSLLEAFHSVQNHFATKRLAFFYHGMTSR